MNVIAFAAFFVAVVGMIWQNNKAQTRNAPVYEVFAAANKLTYHHIDAEFTTGPGTLFIHGDARVTNTILTGTGPSGMPLALFQYKYETGSGKSRRSHEASVARLQLPRVVPHMVIDSHVEGGSANASVLPIQFDQSQRIELEGDFHKYFSLYAPDTYGVTLLTVIGPDAMWALMEHAAACDIEIIDNYMYFYWPFSADTRSEYEAIFSTIDAVVKKLGDKLTKDDIYATHAQARVHSSAVAVQGARLTAGRGKLVAMVTLGVFVILWLSIAFDAVDVKSSGLSFWLIFGVVIFLILAGSIQQSKTAKLRRELKQRFGK